MSVSSIKKTVKKYYYLAKPGIVYGNLLTAGAGFLFASAGNVNLLSFLACVVGIGLVIGSGCTFNNFIDRGIDAKMDRTKKRALVTQAIPARHAIIYGIVLGVVGFSLLAMTHWMAVAVAGVGLLFYVVLYGIGKRKSVHGTLVGSVSGAVPPVVGYTAVTGQLDLAAGFLFLILVCWQMPHFYAIAMYRLRDYKAAGIPVLPAVAGMKVTKVAIIFYIWSFILVAALFSIAGYAGAIYLVGMSLAGIWWLSLAIRGIKTDNDEKWARKVFGRSLVILLLFSTLISVDAYLP